VAYDRELLLCASFLHDAGLYGPASTGDVYIKDSARYARRTLEPFCWPEERLRRCLDACEQHHAFTTRWSMGNEVELVRRSDLVEVIPELMRFGIPRSWLKRELWHAVPRAGFWPATWDVLRAHWRRMLPGMSGRRRPSGPPGSSRRRRRHPPRGWPPAEARSRRARRCYALGLVVIAFIYVGFGVADGRPKVIAVEAGRPSLLLVVVAAGAVIGAPWLLVVGLAGHGLKDLWSTAPTSSPTPRW
jgi:hypothetical protein